MSTFTTDITDHSFEQEVIQSSLPVLVDFWAEWCNPCRAIAPILNDIASEYSGKLKVVKLNVEQNNLIPQKFGVRAIPTLMLFKAGELESTKTGFLSKSQITVFIDSNL